MSHLLHGLYFIFYEQPEIQMNFRHSQSTIPGKSVRQRIFLFFEKCVLCHFKNRDALMVNRLGLRCAREEGRILDCCSQISRRLFPLIQRIVEDQFSDCSGKCHLKS